MRPFSFAACATTLDQSLDAKSQRRKAITLNALFAGPRPAKSAGGNQISI
jgi:hypothetical protein